MMKCYETEELIAFALEPLREENAQISAHIAVCQQCRDEYAAALETVQQDEVFINDADRQEAADVVRSMQESAAGSVRFGNMFRNLLDMIRGGAGNAVSARGGMAHTVAFGSAQSSAPIRSMRSGASDPRITFESCCGKESKYYWKMQMTLPMMVTESSRIMIKVSNANGSAVENGGMLLFLGKKIPVSTGMASIPLKLFIQDAHDKSRDENTVRFMFADSVISRGMIKFLPEAI